MAKKTRKAKATAHEKTRARQIGASVKKPRAEQNPAEQNAADQMASIDSLQKARAAYAEQGDPNSCGDWMAEALKVFRTKDGFDLEGFRLASRKTTSTIPRSTLTKAGGKGDSGCALAKCSVTEQQRLVSW